MASTGRRDTGTLVCNLNHLLCWKRTRLRQALGSLFELDPEVRHLRRHLAERAGTSSVLELGCGAGSNAPLCRGPYLGLDPDPDLVRLARRRFPQKRFELLERSLLARYAGQYHTVLLCLTLHEAQDRPDLLRAAAGLVPGRVLLYDFDPALAGWRRWRVSLLERSHVSSYWDLDLRGLVCSAGLHQTATEPLGPTLRFWELCSRAKENEP